MTRVLLIEDEASDRRLVAEYLRELPDVQLDACEQLAHALDHLGRETFDCALVDLSLPDAQGLEAVEQLRVAAPELPLVVLTGNSDERLALRAMQAGVQDFLGKGEITGPSLSRAVVYAIERQRAEHAVTQLALYDPLTSLANRRLFADRLEQAIARQARHGGRMAVLFGDLDDFKAVNDTYGHGAGDELLCQVAARLQLAVRATDTAARLGGDEFAVLCEQVGGDADVMRVAHRVLRISSAPFTLTGTTLRIAMSLGIACAVDGRAQGPDLLRRADEAMYRAKVDRAGLLLAEAA
jgi:diguanylate cyclase (GGDEF)-like protein